MNRLTALFLALLPLAAQAGTFSDDAEVAAFVGRMAEEHGFDADRLKLRFARIEPNAAVLRAIAPPTSPTQRSWERYRERFVNPRRIKSGVAFWRRHEADLRRAEAEYGVPAEIVAAIIGVETEYGKNTGKFSVFEALATLAFHYPPRADFFRGELEQFLLLTRENGDEPLHFKGSYAGAIGIPQFMPGSQRRYAVDFDGDGRIDLRGSPADAIGSVARFLRMHGWERGGPVAVAARVDGDPAELVAAGIKPTVTLAAMAAQGIVTTGADGEAARPAALIDLVTPAAPTEYWAGFENFFVLTRYNRSSFYAMSVFQLGEALHEAHAARSDKLQVKIN